MAHQRYTFGFAGEDETSHREDRFSPQNEADHERLARIVLPGSMLSGCQ